MCKSEIDQKLLGSLESPLLKMGIIRSCFQAVGKTPVITEVVIIQVIYEAIIERASFVNFLGMPSLPTELVSLMSFIMRITVSVCAG